ncbi:hypothetical protein DAPPUDRAFT_313712 [Daphnia pulex]|uniref:Uncharacterized protein n=1 Tax=Daphnia pulex TaxID=6669 RepID=E9G3Y1_DAPPU|nr:hypothetical protein DAPPUDRAFT_313712 [Daphnia pulex]|eukprot:EFX85852.1 hypothetical protein DAPPUDRAFT_313712 [Daphnia pulex]
MMTWVETAVHFVEMSAIVSCTSHLVQKHFRARVHGQLELFTLLLFGVQWLCSPFPVERCSEMEFVQTCSSTSHLNVSFVYVGVHAVLNGWILLALILKGGLAKLSTATFEVFVGTDLQSARDQQIKWPNPYGKFASCLSKPSETKEFLFARPIPSNDNLQKERHVKLVKKRPIPRNFNLQKERAVRLSFTFEGHGDHYIKRVMQWCRANYGVVLLLCVESLMAGSTTSVPMPSWYGGYQTATPPPYYPKATYATTSYCTEVFKYYTTKAPDLNNTTYAAPSHYTDALKYYSAPSYYTTKAKEDDYACCPILRGSYTEAPNCYTEAPADVFTKTVEYYTEAAKYFSAPIYTTTTEAAKYYAVPTCYTQAALSCYVEQLYYTDVPIYYTTTYATPSYNTAAPKYYTEEAAYYTTTYAA